MVRATKGQSLLALALLSLGALVTACLPTKPPDPNKDFNDQAILSLFGPEIAQLFLEHYPVSLPKPGKKLFFSLSQNSTGELEVGTAVRKGTANHRYLYMRFEPRHEVTSKSEHLHEIWLADRDGNRKIDRIVANYRTPDEKLGIQVIYYDSFMNSRPGALIGQSFSPSDDFFHTTDFEYVQPIDQWKSNYSGSKWFSMFFYDERRGALRATNESPFCFFDKTNRGFSNVVLRVANDVELAGKHHSTFRYSFDADDDATSKTPYDTDFSISGIGSSDLGRTNSKPFRFGQTQTLPVIAWENCEQEVLRGNWDSISLTWIEDDRNAGGDRSLADPSRRRSKRWEGVINLGSQAFPQIGGPPVLELNSRTEIKSPAGRDMVLYVSSLDQKVHLKGSLESTTHIDVFGRGRSDFTTQTIDVDADGYFDRAIYKVSSSTYLVQDAQNHDFFDLKKNAYADLVGAYRELLRSQVDGLCQLAGKLKAKFPRRPGIPDCQTSHFRGLGDERKRFELFGGLLLAMESLKKSGKIATNTVQRFLENHRSDLKIE